MEAYIVSAKRTAVGSFLGDLSTIPAPLLGAHLIKNILLTNNIGVNAIDNVILGQVITAGSGQNPARQSAIYAGLQIETPAMTINKVCGSGLEAVAIAANAIAAGQADLILAGGQENMSLSMHGAYIRNGMKFGDTKFIDFMMYDGLTDAFSNKAMGITAENIVKKFNIDRQAQDSLALRSQVNAAKAQSSGKFKDEIVPIEVFKKKEKVIIDQDEGIRPNTNMEILSSLRPAFEKDGTVTAGNSSTINDGAACVLVASADAIKRYNLTPLAKIVSYASCGVDPEIMGTGPVTASNKALKRAEWQVHDLDLIEANEAFAAQAEYVNRQMGWDIGKVNVNGGAIALGHPIGASGCRILVTLLHEMNRMKAKKGLATLCVGGGMGVAMCLENIS